jgi:hypothetical protein
MKRTKRIRTPKDLPADKLKRKKRMELKKLKKDLKKGKVRNEQNTNTV